MSELTLTFDRGSIEQKLSALGFNPQDLRGPVEFSIGATTFKAFVTHWSWKHELDIHRGKITLTLFEAGVDRG